MSIDNLKERLAGMNDAFQSAHDGGMPEDGDYQAIVHRFDFFESKAGVLFLKTEMRIQLDAKYNGAEVETIHNLEDPDRIQWAKKHLRTLGLNVDNLDLGELQQQLHTVLDVPVAITIKTSESINQTTGERYRNVYVNERLGEPLQAQTDVPVPAEVQQTLGDTGTPAAGAGAINDDEPIPF